MSTTGSWSQQQHNPRQFCPLSGLQLPHCLHPEESDLLAWNIPWCLQRPWWPHGAGRPQGPCPLTPGSQLQSSTVLQGSGLLLAVSHSPHDPGLHTELGQQLRGWTWQHNSGHAKPAHRLLSPSGDGLILLGGVLRLKETVGNGLGHGAHSSPNHPGTRVP